MSRVWKRAFNSLELEIKMMLSWEPIQDFWKIKLCCLNSISSPIFYLYWRISHEAHKKSSQLCTISTLIHCENWLLLKFPACMSFGPLLFITCPSCLKQFNNAIIQSAHGKKKQEKDKLTSDIEHHFHVYT